MSIIAFENAIMDWLRTSSGAHVRVEDTEVPLPPDGVPYGTVRVGDANDIAVLPDCSHEYEPAAPAGQELIVTYTKPQVLTVTVQFYTPNASTLPGGILWAKPVLEKALLDLELPTVRRKLLAAGLGLNRVGPARDLSAISGPKWRGRASAELQFNMAVSVTDRTTYIEEVEARLAFE